MIATSLHQRPTRQHLLWCALVVLFMAGMRGLVYRVRLQFGEVSGSFLDDRPTQVIFHGLYIGAIVVGWRRSGQRLDRRVALPLASLCGLLVLSTTWSIEWGRTLNQSLLVASGTLAVVVLASRLDSRSVLTALVASSAVAVALSVVAVALDWQYSTDRRGRMTGVFYNRNSLGLVASMLLVSSALLWWQRRFDGRVRWIALVLVAVSVTVWWRSGSATSMIAAVSGLLAAAWLVGFTRSSGGVRRVLAWIPVVLVVVVTAAVVWREWFADLIGRDATFTGRTSTWGLLVDTWARRPLVGFGFFAGWFDPELRDGLRAIGYNHWEAHNGYLEVLLGAGVVGVAIVGWLVVSVGRCIWMRRADEHAPVWLALVVFAAVSNVGETNIGANRLVWLVLVAAVASGGSRSSPAVTTEHR